MIKNRDTQNSVKVIFGKENLNLERFFPLIIKVLQFKKNKAVKFSYQDNLILISEGELLFKIPIVEFIENAKLCFQNIKAVKNKEGSFAMPEIESFLASFSITTLKAKSLLKNDITIEVQDPNTFLSPVLGFSIKSQLGRPSTLVNASGVTNFTFYLIGKALSKDEIKQVHDEYKFSDKIKLIKRFGAELKFEQIQNEIFKSNLQTIDFHFDQILAEMLLLFYENDITANNTVPKFIDKILASNPLGYNLKINSSMYELMMKKFLSDYALGMRAGEVWKRDYQATGGYLIVREDGELICYHFYFTKKFEDYLFENTKLDTPTMDKHHFGNIYEEEGIQKIKLNLQIRFIK